MSTEETLVNLDFNGANHNSSEHLSSFSDSHRHHQQQQNYNIVNNFASSANDTSSSHAISLKLQPKQQHRQQPLISSVSALTSESNYSSIDAPVQYRFNGNDELVAAIAPASVSESFRSGNATAAPADNRNSLISLSSNSSAEEQRNFGGVRLSIDTDGSLPDASHEIIMDSRESQPLLGRDAHEYFHNNFTGECAPLIGRLI